ncbi:MAG: hypothetical protein ACKO4R_10775, partial [Synechococcales cyanobacterium]
KLKVGLFCLSGGKAKHQGHSDGCILILQPSPYIPLERDLESGFPSPFLGEGVGDEGKRVKLGNSPS